MKSQSRYFILALAIVSLFFAVVFLCCARFDMLMATGVAALAGPLSGFLWTHDLSSGLMIVGSGLGAVLGVVVMGNVVSQQPAVRSVTAAAAALLWFGFGAYGILMLA